MISHGGDEKGEGAIQTAQDLHPVITELEPEELKSEYSLEAFNFQTTAELSHQDEHMIGQERAIKAMDFGLQIKRDGYNLFVSGLPGTGRNSRILKAVRKIAATEPVPDDICYLHNFERPDESRPVKLRAGQGCDFKEDMESFVKSVKHNVGKAFESEEYEKHRMSLMERFEKEKERLNEDLDKFADEQNLVIKKALSGILVVPLIKNHEISEKEYEHLDDQEKTLIKRRQDEVYGKIYALSSELKKIESGLKQNLEELDKQVALACIQSLVEALRKKYDEYPFIKDYLENIKKDILENLEAFKKDPGQASALGNIMSLSQEDIFVKYQVNVLVDNQKMKGAPVVIEDNPTYYNLVGRIEHKTRFGFLMTDFSLIKPGAVHKANGGYLVLQANELFRDYFAWDALKNILKRKKVKIENIAEHYGFLPTAGLKPDPVEVDLKVILIGSPLVYYILQLYDEDFSNIFKVRVDFDTMLEKDDHLVLMFIKFLSKECMKEGLLPLNKPAVGRIINMGSRLAADQRKMTARLSDLVDLARESDFWARRESAKFIDERHVDKAIEEKIYRSNRVQQKIQEMLTDGTLVVETGGEKVGQVNGLSVLNMGDYTFGTPSRITARTYVGRGHIVNIEREIQMSGRIHSKGVMIMAGFLGHKFAQDKPLTVAASICFEQTYEEVEGDSASSAEVYCLLSSLGDIPLKQSFAVTGSVDQLGTVQAVGGINEKIEGFFDLCRLKGLDGQGVLIPQTNVKNLMLKEEVVESVRRREFHIYPVRTINEGIALLTGLEPGEADDQGRYPPESVYGRVDAQLRRYAE
ncbi:MAG: AAA family ATPase, partial [Candidatus Omnitrophica bacterium]|nr:AAA family ATPase [Candidatus Omnitrophota bacterium]